MDSFKPQDNFNPIDPAHQYVQGKVNSVRRLVSDTLQERQRRIRSKTLPALEELDAEVVQSRRDRLSGSRVTTPFLRLRLRYTDGTGESLPWFFRNASSIAKSFEFECDLSDLDLLQHRLDEARQMLLRAKTQQEVKDADET